jgi:Ankyrin repeats (3 copies)/Ankyrin repeats (many copies)
MATTAPSSESSVPATAAAAVPAAVPAAEAAPTPQAAAVTVTTNTTTKLEFGSLQRFQSAAESGNLDRVQKMYEKYGALIVQSPSHKSGKFALHYASMSGKLAMVQYLVETCRADVNALDTNGVTALHEASAYGKLDIVQYLVKHSDGGADTNRVTTSLGYTLLHSAARWGHLNVAKYLVEQCRVPVDALDHSGHSAVALAKNQNHYDVVRYLESLPHLQPSQSKPATATVPSLEHLDEDAFEF